MLKNGALFLAISLALNAALLGIVGGRMLSGDRPQSNVKLEFERYGPTSDVVQEAWTKLPDKDRQQLRKQLQDEWRMMEPERKRLQAAGRAVYEAALQQPFNEPELRDAVALFQHNETRLQRRAEDILIQHLGGMPPEARATAAVGLLTPYSARVQRNDEKSQGATASEEVAARDDAGTPR